MALDRSPEFKVVTVQIVCVVEIQSESAWALTNITSGNICHAKFHASEASGCEEDDLNIFLCISLVQTQDFYFKLWLPFCLSEWNRVIFFRGNQSNIHMKFE